MSEAHFEANGGNVAVFDTHPSEVIAAESPLHWSRERGLVDDVAGHDGDVKVVERPFLGHLILRGGAITLDEAVRAELGISLPGKPLGLNVDADGSRSVQWLSPDEWLVIVPGGEEFELENRLREHLGDAHFAIVNVSGGQTLVELSGDKARELLMKSVTYDVHSHGLPVGKAVGTVFAKTSVVLRRPNETGFELVIRRSFADYCVRWLLDAGREYGLRVESPSSR
ncbi:sarcosine oxidase subunit gamma [Salinicola avicenniae]|uniref:sarcosine oxidase subunit gamma n=1 Tax=Salinicola avicenniae TaxID=2916836 RepID=UPI0020739367|nr:MULTISPECIES: sarcosine oxidase subunit gamma family protein [unclassified Salinicola]